MDEVSNFRAALRSFADRQPSKAEAARALGVSRQDLYRYLHGTTAPRPRRLRHLSAIMRSRGPEDAGAARVAEHPVLELESVAQLRDVLLHLVSLVELDLADRRGDERKGS